MLGWAGATLTCFRQQTPSSLRTSRLAYEHDNLKVVETTACACEVQGAKWRPSRSGRYPRWPWSWSPKHRKHHGPSISPQSCRGGRSCDGLQRKAIGRRSEAVPSFLRGSPSLAARQYPACLDVTVCVCQVPYCGGTAAQACRCRVWCANSR